MSRIYKVGILHEHVQKNPVLHVETRSKTDYKAIVITPAQTLAILKVLPSPLHRTLVLTCAATALRASEMLALRWRDMLWNEGRIRISKRWAQGKDGATKTEASDGYVPLHLVLARSSTLVARNKAPTQRTMTSYSPQSKRAGAFPYPRLFSSPIICRPAAKKTGVPIQDGQRFGLHNLRHSLSNWLVNKAKVEPKTVQGILRHAKIQTTLDLYTQDDGDETRAAQGAFLKALGMPRSGINEMWVGLWVGRFRRICR